LHVCRVRTSRALGSSLLHLLVRIGDGFSVEPPQDTEDFCCCGSTNVGTVHFVKGSEFEGHETRPAESRVQLATKEEEMVMRIIGIAVLVC
jgi:hypothetical protein